MSLENEKDLMNLGLKENDVTLLDFWAPWCAPCARMMTVIDELAEDYNVIKINVDEEPDLAQKFQVMSVPTIIIFKGFEKKEQISGITPKHALESKLKSYH